MLFLHLGVEEGFASGDHDTLGLNLKVVDSILPFQSRLGAFDTGVAVETFLLDGLETFI